MQAISKRQHAKGGLYAVEIQRQKPMDRKKIFYLGPSAETEKNVKIEKSVESIALD